MKFKETLESLSLSIRQGGGGGLLSAKGGLMMGTKKVGVPSSPQKGTYPIITQPL